MTRAAFLFSGQLRGFPHCIQSMQEYLFSAFDEYDTFFYIPPEDAELLYSKCVPTSATIEHDLYHKEVEGFNNSITYSDRKIAENGYKLHGRMQHYYLQWYGVKRVFELFESYNKIANIDYDAVFRIRCDFKFKQQFSYSPFDGLQIPTNYGHGGIYDRLAFGKQEHMKYYCSLYDKIQEGFYKDSINLGNSESKLLQHLMGCGIPIRFVPMDYDRINKDGSIQDPGSPP